MQLLAIDTGTETLSIAVSVRDAQTHRVWTHQGPAGAAASTSLLPCIQDVMGQAGLSLHALDAIVFGAGPGSFTGLRTACAVAQGLGFGAGVPLLPIDSLLAVAEDARLRACAEVATCSVTAVLDARMDEVYVGTYGYTQGHWSVQSPPQLMRPDQIARPPAACTEPDRPWCLAGNAFGVYAEAMARSPAWGATDKRVQAAPTAQALLRLAPQLLSAGAAVPPAAALPIYIRDKVAKTTVERVAEKALHAGAGGNSTPVSAT